MVMTKSCARYALWGAVALSVVAAVACCQQAGKRLMSRGVGCADKQAILDTHNRLRQSVALGRVAGQPGAANMMEMVSRHVIRYSRPTDWPPPVAHGPCCCVADLGR